VTTVVLDRNFALRYPEIFSAYEELAFARLVHLSEYYPNFSKWYSEKVRPGLIGGERKILLRYVGKNLGGIAILKDSKTEKKLCCLRVMPAYQGSGMGVRLFEDSFRRLETERPLLSICEEQSERFAKVFDHFGFELTRKYENYYRLNKSELSFNGLIDSET